MVKVGGEVVAESRRPVKLFETGMPTRRYLPPEDVRPEVLAPSLTRTICPYKGSRPTTRSPWVSYPHPLGEALQVADHLSFLGDGVEVEVDGAHPQALA